jgi:tetratricopeptide (TPR) repeat protein/tRNA A-37 threonylcarbamoyl transferase component Bud32
VVFVVKQRVKQRLGQYRLLEQLGQGGFSEVYLGEHIYLKTRAAIKILNMRLDSHELDNFLREARTLANLDHPHIVRVLDFGLEEHLPYLVLAFAPHGSMRQRYSAGSILSLSQIVPYAKDIASALQYAHEHSLVHGDIKPENILIGRNEELLLSDFGLAIVSRQAQQTQEHEISGTVAYMAPEQFLGRPLPASDQYGLGLVVYEWLCGNRPFSGSLSEIAMQHLHVPPPPLRERIPDIPPAVEAVVMRALEKDPEDRFATIAHFAQALEEAWKASSGLEMDDRNSVSGQEYTAKTAVSHTMPLWHMPFRRNPCFTGRDLLLMQIHEQLAAGPLAITGLGGIGKTQTVIEYAYRYQSSYTALFLIRAGTYESIIADFVALAATLQLPEKAEQEQQQTILAVKRWLALHKGWLLIFDNVEDFRMVSEFMPPTNTGHILLTTRSQATGPFAERIELEKMPLDEGALLLLRRAKRVPMEASKAQAYGPDFIEARDICKLLDGLPLALDQAGAYIEETGCTLYDYLQHYREQRSRLLTWRGTQVELHSEPVSTTFFLSFEKVEQSSPLAADLLRACAFLHPDEIPEELLLQGASELGEQVASITGEASGLALALSTLRTYSLMRRHSEKKTLSLHRLVQTVIIDSMDAEAQQRWVRRVTKALHKVFPEASDVTKWPLCERYLPQVYHCLYHITSRSLIFPEAASLFNRAGLYALERAEYGQASLLLRQALDMRLELYGYEHPDVPESLNDLASCYLLQGDYEQAEDYYQQALVIQERLQGLIHTDVAVALNNLGMLNYQLGRYSIAETLLKRALHIWEQLGITEHSDLARTLNNLALLYHRKKQYSEAETLYLRGIAMWEHLYGAVHPDHAVNLNNLAHLYMQQQKAQEAEALFKRVLAIREQTLGPEHPDMARNLTFLARLYMQQWRYNEAEYLLKEALRIRRHAFGPDHPDVACTLHELATFYFRREHLAEAEERYQQALRIQEQVFGPDHPLTAQLLKEYAILLMSMKRRQEAKQYAAREKEMRQRLTEIGL